MTSEPVPPKAEHPRIEQGGPCGASALSKRVAHRCSSCSEAVGQGFEPRQAYARPPVSNREPYQTRPTHLSGERRARSPSRSSRPEPLSRRSPGHPGVHSPICPRRDSNPHDLAIAGPSGRCVYLVPPRGQRCFPSRPSPSGRSRSAGAPRPPTTEYRRRESNPHDLSITGS